MSSKKRTRLKKRSTAARKASARPERHQDPRLWAVRAYGQDGVPFKDETWITAVSPVRMEDASVLMWHPPMPIAFNLVEADRHRTRGVKARGKIMNSLKRRTEENA